MVLQHGSVGVWDLYGTVFDAAGIGAYPLEPCDCDTDLCRTMGENGYFFPWHEYDGRTAAPPVLGNVSFSIGDGETVGSVGYNGSGKSVLLKLITGLTKPDQGAIQVDGMTIGKDVDFIWDAGVFINAPSFMNYMSGYDNLAILAEIRKKIGKQEILDVLEQVHLTGAKDKKVKSYSQGMIQRLRIAQAVMEDPKYLIMDEPMNALNEEGHEVVAEILKSSKEKGRTILFTAHDKGDVYNFSDYVLKIGDKTVRKMTLEEMMEETEKKSRYYAK